MFVFVNTIPSCKFSDEDWKEIPMSTYTPYPRIQALKEEGSKIELIDMAGTTVRTFIFKKDAILANPHIYQFVFNKDDIISDTK